MSTYSVSGLSSKRARQVQRVTVNGKDLPLRDVFDVDTQRGIVRTYARDANGHFVIEQGLIVKQEQRGKVRVSLGELV